MAESLDLAAVHSALIGFTKRAEKASEESLVATFVDSAPLFTLLSTSNNQVIYGRRGTGKTHALKVLAEHVTQNLDGISVFIDMRTVGSNGSIYTDSNQPLAERASTLLSDTLAGLLNEFYGIALSTINNHTHPELVAQRLDAFQASISTVRIAGDVSQETEQRRGSQSSASGSMSAMLSKSSEIGFSVSNVRTSENSDQRLERRTGRELLQLTFGTISGALSDLVAILGGRRVWIIIDEWSEVPVDLQPYLADMLRRTVLPLNNVTVKIAAIEHRTDFSILKERGEYIGIELWADVSADLNLDDFLVFDNDETKATDFISNLIFRHYATAPANGPDFKDSNAFIAALFTQRPVFDEFVRAVEGVPRDALNLITKVVSIAFNRTITMNDVRSAARSWYNEDKAAVIRTNAYLGDLLQYIVSEVIGNRRARGFMFTSKIKHHGLEKLFDSRLLHVLKKNVSSRDEPGERYDVYKIDYGCYVDLINTTKSTLSLFVEDDGELVEVPKDDYRSIRRAILYPKELP